MNKLEVTLLVGAASLWTVALGSPKFSKDFADTYGVKKDTALGRAGCAACHVGKTAKLNPYGIDMQKAMRSEKTKLLTGSVLKKIEGLDSDKDEKSNLDEIKAGLLPGDPKSK